MGTLISDIIWTEQGVDGLLCSPDDLLFLLQQRYGKHLKLEFGPGRRKKKDKAPWATIGLNPSADPMSDIYFDLDSAAPIPLPDNCISEIYSNQVLEHLDNIIHHMNECWRILESGGELFACVPHRASPWAVADPTHKRLLVKESFQYFCIDPATGEPFVDSFSDYGIKCAFIMEKCEVRPKIDIKIWLRKP